MATIAQIMTRAIAVIQPTIDTVVTANQALYDQQSSLQAQITALNQQLAAVNAQILALEAGDVANSRAAIAALNAVINGQMGRLTRAGLR